MSGSKVMIKMVKGCKSGILSKAEISIKAHYLLTKHKCFTLEMQLGVINIQLSANN